MALFVLYPGIQPLGDFDVLDTDMANIKGGEVMVLGEASRTVTTTEKAAMDVLDGYISVTPPAATRTVAMIADTAAIEAQDGYVFYLADEGTSYYGVTLGSVIGVPVGLSTTGTNLGPHTMSGSGKVTLHDKPGLYAVSTDAVDADLIDESVMDTPLPGELLYRSATGLLARVGQAGGPANKVAAFVELTSNGSLVTTPARLVGAAETFDRVKIQFFGAGFAS